MGPKIQKPAGSHEMTAWELLQAAGRDGRTYTIDANDTIRMAMQRMYIKRVGYLVVTHNNCFVGVIHVRELLFTAAKASSDDGTWAQDWEKQMVGEVMMPAAKTVCVQPSDTAGKILSIMAKTGVKKIPVIDTTTDDNHETFVVGVLSYRDCINAVLANSSYFVKDAKAQFINDILPRTGVPKNTHIFRSSVLSKGPLFLESSCKNIPHPLKKMTGGEDGWFSLTAKADAANNFNPTLPFSVIGVADGVSSWKYEHGLDAGIFSRRMMASAFELVTSSIKESNAAIDTDSGGGGGESTGMPETGPGAGAGTKTQKNSASNKAVASGTTATANTATTRAAPKLFPKCDQILEHAVRTVSKEKVPGSSTICVATLHRSAADQSSRLHIASVGDSGVLVLRHHDESGQAAASAAEIVHALLAGRHYHIVFRSLPQLHEFDRPMQVGVDLDGSSKRFDQPSDAQVEDVIVHEGDIIVMASDGLFDNLSDETILDIVDKEEDKIMVMQAKGMKVPLAKPKVIADSIATRAFEMSIQKKIDSPFAQLAKDNNIMYSGGRKDDITVIVARVMRGGAAPLRGQ